MVRALLLIILLPTLGLSGFAQSHNTPLPVYKPVTATYIDSILYPPLQATRKAGHIVDSLNRSCFVVSAALQNVADSISAADSLLRNNKEGLAALKKRYMALLDSRQEHYNTLRDSLLDAMHLPNPQRGKPKFHYSTENVNDATAEKIAFKAECCGDFGLYAGRVALTDTADNMEFQLTNVNIAGVDPKTKVGNDVGGIALILNGHDYYLPVVSYNKSKTFGKRVQALFGQKKMVTIKGRLITGMKNHPVLPLFLIDDVVIAK